MRRSPVVTLMLATAMVGAAWLELRTPDFGEIIDFFTSRIPTLAAGEAVMTLMAWIAVVVAAFGTLSCVLTEVRKSRRGRQSTSYAWILVVAGLVLFSVGAARHALPSASVCCGSGAANMREAIGLAH